MFARLAIGMCAAFGVAGAIVEATLAEGGSLVFLTEQEEAAVVAGIPWSSTDCTSVGTCPTNTAGPPQFGTPCTNPGGFCSSPYCRDSSPDYACTPVTTYNPLDWACVVTGSFPCYSDILRCSASRFCTERDTGLGPNPTLCGSHTTCMY